MSSFVFTSPQVKQQEKKKRKEEKKKKQYSKYNYVVQVIRVSRWNEHSYRYEIADSWYAAEETLRYMFLDVLDDFVKLYTYADEIEDEEDVVDYSETDEQRKQREPREATVVVVKKTPKMTEPYFHPPRFSESAMYEVVDKKGFVNTEDLSLAHFRLLFRDMNDAEEHGVCFKWDIVKKRIFTKAIVARKESRRYNHKQEKPDEEYSDESSDSDISDSDMDEEEQEEEEEGENKKTEAYVYPPLRPEDAVGCRPISTWLSSASSSSTSKNEIK